jgi:hypothetical protein
MSAPRLAVTTESGGSFWNHTTACMLFRVLYIISLHSEVSNMHMIINKRSRDVMGEHVLL